MLSVRRHVPYPVRAVRVAVIAGLAGWVSGCATAAQERKRTQELQALRVDVAALRDAQQQSDLEHAERVARLEGSLLAQLQSLHAELQQLQSQVRTQLAEAQADAEEAPETEDETADAPVRNTPRRARRRAAEPAAPPPAVSEADEVRALMASVADKLQHASDAKNGKKVSAARRDQAQQRLVEADRAAAQGLWARARELAHEAETWLGEKPASQAQNTAPDALEALMRDAEALFPGAVRPGDHGVWVRLPLARAPGDLPIERSALARIARLAKVYGALSLTVQLREPEPNAERAGRVLEAVRQHLISEGHVPEGRIRNAHPETRPQDGTPTLVVGFVSS